MYFNTGVVLLRNVAGRVATGLSNSSGGATVAALSSVSGIIVAPTLVDTGRCIAVVVLRDCGVAEPASLSQIGALNAGVSVQSDQQIERVARSLTWMVFLFGTVLRISSEK